MATIVATTTPFLSISDHRTNAVPASMNCSLPLSSRLRANPSCLFLAAHLRLRPFSASSSPTDVPAEVASSPGSGAGDNGARVRVGAMASTEARQLRESWLASLSCPPPPRGFGGLGGDGDVDGGEFDSGNAGSDWVIGIDPDTHGAVAVLKGHGSDCFAQVFDSPNLPVLVSGRVRRRLDAKSITEMLRSLDAPIGSTAYIEQSIPYPKDGKQGWWSGGFGYGLWIGILVAVGFSVVPVPSVLWKRKFELSGSLITKDDSRRVASTLFPSLSSLLKRKKDHGRAEALLIAAYGRGIKMELDSSIAVDELIS